MHVIDEDGSVRFVTGMHKEIIEQTKARLAPQAQTRGGKRRLLMFCATTEIGPSVILPVMTSMTVVSANHKISAGVAAMIGAPIEKGKPTAANLYFSFVASTQSRDKRQERRDSECDDERPIENMDATQHGRSARVFSVGHASEQVRYTQSGVCGYEGWEHGHQRRPGTEDKSGPKRHVRWLG